MNIVLFTLIVLTAVSSTVAAWIGVAQGGTEEQEPEFSATLTGQAVIPQIMTNVSGEATQFVIPPVMTNASGEATFTLSEGGDEVAYELRVQDIEDVVNAHMHVGNATRYGPILVTLYNIQTSEQPNEVGGSFAAGEFTAEDFERKLPRVQNMTSLLDLIEDGNIYVDVHTLTYPKGELRGTIEVLQEEASE